MAKRHYRQPGAQLALCGWNYRKRPAGAVPLNPVLTFTQDWQLVTCRACLTSILGKPE